MKPEWSIAGASLEQRAVHGVLEIPATSGVYALIDNDSVVYVGRSSNMRKRIGQHLTEGVKDFCEYRCYPLREGVQVLETYLIRRIAPRYNSCPGDETETPVERLDALVREWSLRRGPHTPPANEEEAGWRDRLDQAILDTGTIPPKAPTDRVGRKVWHEYAARLIKAQVDAQTEL